MGRTPDERENPGRRQPEPIQRPDAAGSLQHHLFQGQLAVSIQGERHQAGSVPSHHERNGDGADDVPEGPFQNGPQ